MSQTYTDLNAELYQLTADGKINFEADREAANRYFLEHVNQNTVFFHTLREKYDYLVTNKLWKNQLGKYSFEEIKDLFKQAYAHKFRFATFVGALKFYTAYALKTPDGSRYLERYEDRVCIYALEVADGDIVKAAQIVEEVVSGRFQPATPTFLNAGRENSGDLTSCYLLRLEDNMESIGRGITDSLQLSKRGGGVALLLTNLRETGAPIKGIENQASGVIPVMKLLEDSFSYANQLGQRQGAGAVYLNVHHPDIMDFLDTKRENADEKVRIKTLSLGVVIPDITFELARRNEDMYLFSPYDVERVEGKPFADLSVTEHYRDWVDNPEIRKTKISPRKLFRTLAEIQFESGYPYIMFEDTANRHNPAPNVGRIVQSNLCVAPETRVLTDEGYKEIQSIAGTEVNAWNGEEFTAARVEKTGEAQELITINLSNGASLDVTPYHKFYVKNDYKKPAEEVRAGELQEGDKLEKFDLGIVNHPEAPDFPQAYTAGLHSAEGTYAKDGKPILRLYPGKLHLEDHIEYSSSSHKVDASGRVSYVLKSDIPRKFHVPTEYSLQSRLDWFAGLIDGDGWGNAAVGIQIASIHADFLEEVRVMLTTLGVHSKWGKHKDAGRTRFKLDQKEYDVKEIFRLVISGSEAQKLVALGMKSHRVIIEKHELQRSATNFVKVVSVVAEGRVDDTYCLNEPKRHRVVFEGIETGNCSEIMQPSTPSIYFPDGEFAAPGDDISCNLGSLNVAKVLEGNIATAVETAYEALNYVANTSEFASSPSVKKGNSDSRAIGLGQMNLHGALIERGLDYDSEEARLFFHAYMDAVTYHLINASMLKASNYGYFHGFRGSRWEDGSYIDEMIDHRTERATDGEREAILGVSLPTVHDWMELRDNVMEYGVYNRNLQAIPPTGSISYINNATASIHPITAGIEVRKEGKLGRVYYPAYGLNNDNAATVKDAFQIGPNPIIDMYAEAAPYVDQSMSMTLFFPDTATTRDINKAQIYAHKKGVKSIYYIRTRQAALSGTGVDGCLSCML